MDQVPFLQVIAPALADGTTAADLFGVVERYATGVKGRPGFFEQAHGGVLLIDEIGDTPPNEQAKLLTVLQEREVTPLGGEQARPFDCLIIAATNRDLPAAVAAGTFRADLYDRLSRYSVDLAPLDDRPEDLPFIAPALLARHGLDRELDAESVERLLDRTWPGNVRQLDALIDRVVAVSLVDDRQTIDARVIEQAEAGLAETGERRPLPSHLVPRKSGSARPSADELRSALETDGWNKAAVARRYGKDPRQIRRWMAYLGIEEPA